VVVAAAQDDVDLVDVTALRIQSQHVFRSGTILLHEILGLLLAKPRNPQVLPPFSPVELLAALQLQDVSYLLLEFIQLGVPPD
jgi:hypothetical protein